MKIITAVLLVLIMATGCATAVRGPKQEVHINAYDAKTSNLVAADCLLTNDEGVVETKSNRNATIGRDKDPLTVECHTDTLSGKSIIPGKINVGYWAVDFFIIDACIITGWIDGLSGSWAEYPSMIDVSLDLKSSSN